MLEIDGSQKSGSGTILRLSVALSAINQEPLHIYNIRHNRKQPGLRPQHLESIIAATKLCNAETKGVELDSHELWFKPDTITGGEVTAKIGTAGSIPMLLLTVLPICAYARQPCKVHVMNGGTDVRYAPTINYIKHVMLPVLEEMGLKASITVKKYGYYPKGMGEIVLNVNPVSSLQPINLTEFGAITEIEGISVCTFLEKQKVAQRQAQKAANSLENCGYKTNIHVLNDYSNRFQKGSSITLWAKTSKGALIGADAIGEKRKTSEAVGQEAAENLLKEIQANASVDVHLADMLVPYVGLANGQSAYFVRKITDHIQTNIWLMEKILGIKIQVEPLDAGFLVRKL
ncbi:MAG: RNA 3'-terminal phosphate cyclase [Candidatus Bathyarchaeum tardum]|nr:MAG: RNA 3'-terminal phosphate cyclase [Candidatus Bathyarchaeum tardum]